MRSNRLTKPITTRRLRVTSCPICGDPLTPQVDGDNCPGCNQPSRTRSLGPVMEEVVWPTIDKALVAHRVEDGSEGPRAEGEVEAHAGYVEYLPTSHEMLDIRVGRDWLLQAIARNGFRPTDVYVEDSETGTVSEWFVGHRGGRHGPAAVTGGTRGLRRLSRAATSLPLRLRRSRHRPGAGSDAPKSRTATRRGADEAVYSVPVDSAFGFSRVVVRLTLPSGARTGRFGEHVWDELRQESTPTVIAVYSDGVAVSEDNGFEWGHVSLPAVKGLNVRNCFTTSRGTHLLHAIDEPGKDLVLLRFAEDWTLLDRQELAHASWHARGAIGERNGVIMFAEYPDNVNKYRVGRGEELGPDDEPPLNSRVFRSTDEGVSWNIAFEKDWTEIRHFHTVVPDPYEPGVWWLSSGDRQNECRVWRSADDGVGWQEATNPEPPVDLGPYQHLAQASHRQTDVYITKDELFWGADD